jgi:hypothetical protein
VDFDGEQLSLRDHDIKVSGRVQLHGKLVKLDLDTNDTDLSGSTLSVTDLSIDRGDKHTKHFWCRMGASPCLIHPEHPVMTEATIAISLENLSPVVDVLSANISVPGIVKLLSDRENVNAKLDLRVGKTLVEMNHIVVEAGTIKAVGRVAMKGSETNALVLLNAGTSTIGIDVINNHVGVQLLDARRWYLAKISGEPTDDEHR